MANTYLAVLLLSLIGGAGGSLAVQFFFYRNEVVKLRRSVDDLRNDVASRGNDRSSAKALDATGTRSRTVTDKKGNVFDVFVTDIRKSPIRIYYQNETGTRFGTFERVKESVEARGEELAFATNGGMFSPGGTPVGLLIVDSHESCPLNLAEGPDGNFFLKPNGVFGITDKEAFVMESSQFSTWREKQKIVFATQSGPMLLIDGKVHPKFRPNSPNLTVRSGVGIISPSQVVFAISEKDVSFYDFAIMFQQQFKCKNALYLDGFISRMYLPALDRYDLEGEFGSIIAVSK